jgi:hypothetical protein
MSLTTLSDGILGVIKENPIAVGVGTVGAAVGVGLGTAAIVKAVKRRKTKRAKARNSRKRNNRNKRSKKRTKHTKRTSHKRIRYTKKGQPYIILKSGKARFIKKRSAKSSKKRKGGYY